MDPHFLRAEPSKPAAGESRNVLSRAGRFHHPDSRHLARFMSGQLPRDEASAVVRHLLTGCRECLTVTGRLWQLGDCLVLPLSLIGESAAWNAGRPIYNEPLF